MIRGTRRLACLAALALAMAQLPGYKLAMGDPAAQRSAFALVAPGRVEPYSEEREIASQVIGILQDVKVEENDVVEAGQVIAVVENSEEAARLRSAQAELAQRKAELEKALNGPRPEELNEAKANLSEMDANLVLARQDYDRKVPLTRSGASAVSVLDQATSTLRASESRRNGAAARLALLVAGTRPEDIAVARAQLALADADVALAQSLFDKTLIRSPISGTILRRLRVPGEAVTNVNPTPIAIVGDLSRLRVRAEIDETDIGHVALGQRVEVSVDAFPGKRFGGAVVRISQRLGAKEVQTGRPAEKIDMKVLQVLIDLDAGVRLPAGLRVDVYVLATAPGLGPGN